MDSDEDIDSLGGLTHSHFEAIAAQGDFEVPDSTEELRRRAYRRMDEHESEDLDHLIDSDGDGDSFSVRQIILDEESVLAISLQLFIPFLLAGYGMVCASLLLDFVQHWEVFQTVPELYILVPALLGLKGNLEMTLASRLSTQANLGYIDSYQRMFSLVCANMCLIQCQALTIGFLASLAAVAMGWVPEGKFDTQHALLLCASSIVTASVASLTLGLIMVAVILISKRYHINPDNVATPIAASLGDLTTLALLSFISANLYSTIYTYKWLAPIIITAATISVPFWGYIAFRHPQTRSVLTDGWFPVICGVMISSMGGLVLDYTISNYKGIAVYQLIINGVGGNLVAVQASRMSTSLHMECELGKLPPYVNPCLNPLKVFCDKGGHARTARVLLLMVIPGHLIFAYTISYLQAGHTSLTPTFMLIYLTAALIQVILLLYICSVMVYVMWLQRSDPDNAAIPYLTAIGDLLGTALLGIAFHILYMIGDKDGDLGD